jgi:hypothetical protein
MRSRASNKTVTLRLTCLLGHAACISANMPSKTTQASDARAPLDALYVRFTRIWSNGKPVVGLHALAAMCAALGAYPNEISDEQLRALNEDWVHGESNRPFKDEELNRRYLRIAAP